MPAGFERSTQLALEPIEKARIADRPSSTIMSPNYRVSLKGRIPLQIYGDIAVSLN